MSPRVTVPTSPRRLVPVSAARRGKPDAGLRRYRLARVESDTRGESRERRFEHLKRTFD